jgi:phosphoglycolate phosphatase
MRYQNIIFDLDGTLTNPYLGILNSLRFSLQQLQFSQLPNQVPSEFIGPPLQQSFKEIFGLNEKQTNLAVEYFREYYGKAGLYENELFEGIGELLAHLYENGNKLFVATSKLKKYAKLILEHFELNAHLDDFAGADYSGNHTKAQLISELMHRYQLHSNETVMIGDTHFDLLGAKEAGIDAIAVGYGFGNKENLLTYDPAHYFDTLEELTDFLV